MRWGGLVAACAVLTACNNGLANHNQIAAAQATKRNWDNYQPPDWRKYRASITSPTAAEPSASGVVKLDESARFTFHDLKTESDQSLAQRLLGAVGKRIAFIDRHRDHWAEYRSDNQPAELIDLYTHPAELGSQYGFCGVERYSVIFDSSGHVSTVSVAPRYGIEGPIYLNPDAKDADWRHQDAMCKSASASHVASYFPAPDGYAAQSVAMLLLPVIDLAGSTAPLPYRLDCHNAAKQPCGDEIRKYLGALRLGDIDEFSKANCPLFGGSPGAICFTIETGEGQLGPFPKFITVKGVAFTGHVKVESVTVDEGSTMI